MAFSGSLRGWQCKPSKNGQAVSQWLSVVAVRTQSKKIVSCLLDLVTWELRTRGIKHLLGFVLIVLLSVLSMRVFHLLLKLELYHY